MNPSEVLLAVYALSQLAQVVQKALQSTEGVSDEQLAAAYKAQGDALKAAIDRWKSLP